jgi:hypothetical protein
LLKTNASGTLVAAVAGTDYVTPAGLSGYVPTSRTITINGTAFDLSADRSYSVGTVTSVGLSSATTGVTIGSSPITTNGTITLAIATASGSQQGLLSSTDWTTFNNKASTAALANYLPLTGGTLTGALGGTSASFSSTLTAGDTTIINVAPILAIQSNTTGNIFLRFRQSADTMASMFYTNATATFTMSNNMGGLRFNTSSTSDAMNITGFGNVGISTNNPLGSASERTLHLSDGGAGFATLYVTNGANTLRGIFAISNSASSISVGSQSNHNFTLVSNDSPRMTIVGTNGNVGINISSSILSKLHVEQNADADGIFLSRSGANKQAIFISSDANVGAYIAGGTNPNNTATQNDGFGRLVLQGGTSEGFQFQTSSVSGGSAQSWTTRMKITNSGQIYLPRFISSSTDVINIEAGSSFSGRGILINMDAGNDAITIGGSGSQNAINVTSSGKRVIISNLGGTGTRAVLADSSGLLSAPVSDISVKQNINTIGYGLNEILKMNPVWFNFIDEYKNYGEGRQNGNIAQEMELIIPEAVFTTPTTGKMGINYDQLHAVYIKAIQELKAELEELKAKIK